MKVFVFVFARYVRAWGFLYFRVKFCVYYCQKNLNFDCHSFLSVTCSFNIYIWLLRLCWAKMNYHRNYLWDKRKQVYYNIVRYTILSKCQLKNTSFNNLFTYTFIRFDIFFQHHLVCAHTNTQAKPKKMETIQTYLKMSDCDDFCMFLMCSKYLCCLFFFHLLSMKLRYFGKCFHFMLKQNTIDFPKMTQIMGRKRNDSFFCNAFSSDDWFKWEKKYLIIFIRSNYDVVAYIGGNWKNCLS